MKLKELSAKRKIIILSVITVFLLLIIGLAVKIFTTETVLKNKVIINNCKADFDAEITVSQAFNYINTHCYSITNDTTQYVGGQYVPLYSNFCSPSKKDDIMNYLGIDDEETLRSKYGQLYMYMEHYKYDLFVFDNWCSENEKSMWYVFWGRDGSYKSAVVDFDDDIRFLVGVQPQDERICLYLSIDDGSDKTIGRRIAEISMDGTVTYTDVIHKDVFGISSIPISNNCIFLLGDRLYMNSYQENNRTFSRILMYDTNSSKESRVYEAKHCVYQIFADGDEIIALCDSGGYEQGFFIQKLDLNLNLKETVNVRLPEGYEKIYPGRFADSDFTCYYAYGRMYLLLWNQYGNHCFAVVNTDSGDIEYLSELETFHSETKGYEIMDFSLKVDGKPVLRCPMS